MEAHDRLHLEALGGHLLKELAVSGEVVALGLGMLDYAPPDVDHDAVHAGSRQHLQAHLHGLLPYEQRLRGSVAL